MQQAFEIKGILIGKGRPVVCVPIVEKEKEAILAKVKELTQKKVKMIEWRVDTFAKVSNPEAVRGVLEAIAPFLAHTILIFTFRSKQQGGTCQLPEKKITWLNEMAAKSKVPDLVDLEFFEASRPERDIRRLQNMGVKVIASHHDFDETPDDRILHMLMEQMQEGGADIAKLAMMPRSSDDVLRLLKLTNDTRQKYPELPIVTMSMGAYGVISRLCGEVFGSCITFGADGAVSAPGQMQMQQLNDVLDALHESMTGNRRHLYLIGFMGTGKSTVSKKLHGRLHWPELDMDQQLVEAQQMEITEMFERYGENYFRDQESALLADIAKRKDPLIVSCGGGTVLREENVALMKESGTIVLLTAEAETVFRRVRYSSNRPVLNGHMNVEYIASLQEKRKQVYEDAYDIKVATDEKRPGELADEIIQAAHL